VNNSTAQQLDHEAIAKMTNTSRAAASVHRPADALLWGFGFGDATLVAEMAKPQDSIRWSAEKTEETGVFLLQRFIETAAWNGRPDLVLTVDANKGFLITRVRRSSGDGQLAYQADVTCTRVGDDRTWFPTIVEDKRPVRSPNAETPYESTKIVFRNVQINPALDDAQFRIDKLALADGVVVVRQRSDGGMQPLVAKDGIPVPGDISGQQMQGRHAPIKETVMVAATQPDNPRADIVAAGGKVGGSNLVLRDNTGAGTLIIYICSIMLVIAGAMLYLIQRRGTRRGIK